jgi:hypothetical protein
MITKQDITRTIFSLCKDCIAPQEHQTDFRNNVVFMNGARISFDEKTFTLHDQYYNTQRIHYAWMDHVSVESGKYGVTIMFGTETEGCAFIHEYGLKIYNY